MCVGGGGGGGAVRFRPIQPVCVCGGGGVGGGAVHFWPIQPVGGGGGGGVLSAFGPFNTKSTFRQNSKVGLRLNGDWKVSRAK